jgi:hypothetical protein
MNQINWGLAGQVLTVWVIVAFIAAPFIGAWVRKARKGHTAKLNHAALARQTEALTVADAIENSRGKKVIPLRRDSDEPPPKRAA